MNTLLNIFYFIMCCVLGLLILSVGALFFVGVAFVLIVFTIVSVASEKFSAKVKNLLHKITN